MSVAMRTTYTKAASVFHWFAAVPLIGSIGAVLKAQQSPKAEKGTWMYRHKSMGLLTGMIVFPRVAYRVLSMASYRVMPLAGNSALENSLGSFTHRLLYGFMVIMPASGIAMGYYGGKGLPFFYKTIPGADTPNGWIAKNAFAIHKNVGVYGKYLVPAHVGAAGLHYVRGQPIFRRVNPFAKPRG